MKKIIIIGLLYFPITAFPQSRILDKIRQKAEERAERKLDQTIDKSLDKAEEEVEETVKEQSTPQPKQQKAKPAKTPSPLPDSVKPNTGLKSYSKFDFMPGERIKFAEDFASDEIGNSR